MEELHPGSLRTFSRSIAVLALPAVDQVGWLESLGLGHPRLADERALKFDDGMMLLDQFVSLGWISAALAVQLRELDALLGEMSKSAQGSLWEVSQLATATEWDKVRSAAKKILFAL